MFDPKDAGPYNEINEKQRCLNALEKHDFRLDDKIAKLGWNIAIQYANSPTEQSALFAEIANLIHKARG
jgi:hypothetical protein